MRYSEFAEKETGSPALRADSLVFKELPNQIPNEMYHFPARNIPTDASAEASLKLATLELNLASTC